MKDNKDYNDVNINPDIEKGKIFEIENYICEVDDYNQDNLNESIVFIYDSKEKYNEGEYLEQVSLLNKNIKNNIQEYIAENYGIQKVTRLGILIDLLDQINNNKLMFSNDYLMSEPKAGWEKYWKIENEKSKIVQQMINEEKNRKRKKDIER